MPLGSRWFWIVLLLVAACGGPKQAADFTLQDDRGTPWTLSQQRGKAVLLTFGFTHCADTCPATLAKLVATAQSIGARSQSIEIVFVTVDPKRDSPPVLHRFIRRFDRPGLGSVVGLTGTPQQIAAVQRAYHVWSQAMPSRHGHYEVAHGAAIFLIDDAGRLQSVRDDEDTQAALAAALRQLLG